MDNALGEKAAPFGAPETTVAPGWGGGFFENGRPRLGVRRARQFPGEGRPDPGPVVPRLPPKPPDGWCRSTRAFGVM